MKNKALKLDGYQVLLKRVRKILIDGQRRIEAERVRTYWETGRAILDDILEHKDRADYGAEVVKYLADDLDMHPRLLQYSIRFARVYPRAPIVNGRSQFNWGHYRALMAVPDDKLRLSLEKAAAQNGWTAEELTARIKKDRPQSDNHGIRDTDDEIQQPSRKPLVPLRGMLYTYQIVKRPAVNANDAPELRVDLGFGVFHKVEARLLSAFKEGDIVESRPKDDAYKFYKTDRTAKDLYTYAADIEKIIDGDTLKVRFDLGFNIEIRQTLRLRGLDCPEMDTKEGQQAKAFVQSHIKEATQLIVRSSRSDKYDRYLADVFIPQGAEPDPETDICLNNSLLQTGNAKYI